MCDCESVGMCEVDVELLEGAQAQLERQLLQKVRLHGAELYYQSNGFRKSTPAQNRQLLVYYD